MAILIWMLLGSPAIPLHFLWLHGKNSMVSRLGAVILTISYAWLVLALVSPLENRLLGPTYSGLRIAIPYANVAAVSAVMILLLIRGERKTVVLMSSACIILCWLYVRVISFSV